MTVPLRILDTGLLPARRNLALTAALADLHQTGVIPDTLRFQHFHPSAIVGRHQSLAREVRLDRCREKGVETARRMTGGGAIYMGPGMLGWELIADRVHLPIRLDEITLKLCTGLARGLSGLGIAAAFRPRNDIEVDGRKVSGTGGYVDGRTLVFQGTVLIDFDVGDMVDVLAFPTMKLDRKGLASLEQRITSLRVLTGKAPVIADVCAAVTEGLAEAGGWTPAPGSLTPIEQDTANRLYDAEIGTDAFVTGDEVIEGRQVISLRQTPAGLIEVAISVRQSSDPRIERIWVTGDFFATPPRIVPDLESALTGVPLQQASTAAHRFLEARPVQLLAGSPADLVAAIADAATAFKRDMPPS